MTTSCIRRSGLLHVLALAFFLAPASLHAQDSTDADEHDRFWIWTGVGGGPFGVAAAYGVSYQSGWWVISYRSAANAEFSWDFISMSHPIETITDAGLLFGVAGELGGGMASISAGVSAVSGVRRGALLFHNQAFFGDTYEEVRFHAVGLSLEAHLFYAPLSFFGAGLYVFGNVNSQQSFYGGLLCITLGRL